jgi:hypothetical protein
MTKVVPPKNGWEQQSKPKALLPLVPEVEPELRKDQTVSLELYSDPANKATSPKYKFAMQLIDGTEDVRTLLNWVQNVATVLMGMDITIAVNVRQMTDRLCRGTARSIFRHSWDSIAGAAKQQAHDAAADPAAKAAVNARAIHEFMTPDLMRSTIRAVVSGCTPKKVLQRVKRYMRREMRKPKDMKIRQYLVHLNRMNNEEVPHLPPFDANQGLTDDELIDILLYAVPKSWTKEMDKQGFDPVTKSPEQVVDFLEQIETAEEFDPDKQKQVSNNPKQKGKMQKHGSNNNNAKGNSNKYCMLHGKGSHSTEECRNMQAQAKRMKTNGGASKPSGGTKNKTWNRKDGDKKITFDKNEINSLVKKAVKKAAQKEINALSKKRKSDDSDSEEEMNNIEGQVEDMNLNDFNSEDLQKVLDDDEITV